MMQPWLDVEKGASTVMAIAEDRQAAQTHAVQLTEKNDSPAQGMSARDVYGRPGHWIVRKNDTPKPVILADSADSSNAGAAAVGLLSLDYEKLPESFYPFSSLDDYQIAW